MRSVSPRFLNIFLRTVSKSPPRPICTQCIKPTSRLMYPVRMRPTAWPSLTNLCGQFIGIVHPRITSCTIYNLSYIVSESQFLDVGDDRYFPDQVSQRTVEGSERRRAVAILLARIRCKSDRHFQKAHCLCHQRKLWITGTRDRGGRSEPDTRTSPGRRRYGSVGAD